MEDERPKPRWFRFSLRTMLIAVLVLSLPLSWFAVKMQKASRQRKAVETIEKMGVAVYFRKKPYPKLLRRVLGDDFFDTAVIVVFHYPNIPNSELRHLKGMPSLEGVGLDNTKITDAGLRYLEALTNLEELSLDNTEITDAGIERLEGLPNLRWLSLNGTQVTNEGIRKLQEALPNCKIEY